MTETSRSSAAFDVPLADFEALALDGPDAVAFAQSQLAADVAAVAIGHWRWACWLEPKGRVIALLLLLRPTADRILLVLPGHRAVELAPRLQRYVMRSKVKITPIQPPVHGSIDPSRATTLAIGGPISGDSDAWRIELGGAAGRGIAVGGEPACDSDADGARARWRLADAADGIPWLEGAAIEAWIPQSLGLSRLDAFSTRKGCYPGQEIVARTHFLGRTKRGLWRSALPPGAAPPAPGTRCLPAGAGTEAESIAEVVYAAPAAAGGWVLAVGREGHETRLHAQGSADVLEFPPI
jgi:folate-binding protein YgfZ